MKIWTLYWTRYWVAILSKKESEYTLYGVFVKSFESNSFFFRAIKIGDKEVEYNSNFRLILHTKLANPHYKPEMQAQTTLINFTVTRDGLEDQLLAEVVKAERPDLEDLKAELTKQQNDFKIMLKKLEDDLLSRLSSAGENILGDTALVENLETTKSTASEIELKVRRVNGYGLL